MAPQLYRRKYKNRPKLKNLDCDQIKTSFQNESILKKYGLTLDGKSKFYVDTILCEDYSFCVFKSETIMKMISENVTQRRFLIDGTFKTAAKPFSQCVTISVEYKGEVSFFGCIVIPLTNKVFKLNFLYFRLFPYSTFCQHPKVLNAIKLFSNSLSSNSN